MPFPAQLDRAQMVRISNSVRRASKRMKRARDTTLSYRVQRLLRAEYPEMLFTSRGSAINKKMHDHVYEKMCAMISEYVHRNKVTVSQRVMKKMIDLYLLNVDPAKSKEIIDEAEKAYLEYMNAQGITIAPPAAKKKQRTGPVSFKTKYKNKA